MAQKSHKRLNRDAVWAGLQKYYSAELETLHKLQHRDIQEFGRVMPGTEAKLDALLEKIVRDNKKEGRT